MSNLHLGTPQNSWGYTFDNVTDDLKSQARDCEGTAMMSTDGLIYTMDTYDLHKIRYPEISKDRLKEIKQTLTKQALARRSNSIQDLDVDISNLDLGDEQTHRHSPGQSSFETVLSDLSLTTGFSGSVPSSRSNSPGLEASPSNAPAVPSPAAIAIGRSSSNQPSPNNPSPSISTPQKPKAVRTIDPKLKFVSKDYEREAWEASQDRFNPAFLKPCPPQDLESKITDITAWLKTQPKELRSVLAAQSFTEHAITDAFVKCVNEIGKRMYGKQAKRMINNGAYGLQPNPDLKFQDSSKRNPYDTSHALRPDIVVGSGELEDSISRIENWKDAGLVGEAKKFDTADMRCTSTANDNPVPRTLRYQQVFVYNHPITGRTFSITISGHSVRLWYFDAWSFASSRVCRFDRPEHYRDLVEILAFVVQPKLPQQIWSPNPGFSSHDGDGSLSEEWAWQPDADGDACKLLEVRMELFGTRTVVWTGIASRRNRPADKGIRVFLKLSFTINGDVSHEYNMLKRLHDPDPAYPIYASHTPDPEVIDCLAKPLGMLSDIPSTWKTQAFHGRALALSGLNTTGKLGEPLPMNPQAGFGVRAYVQVLQGVWNTLWHAASKGLHYRDINEGNIFYIKLPDGRYIGYLIDFGNARYLNYRRIQHGPVDENDVLLLCKDDGRSINELFQSVASMEATVLDLEYRTATEDLNIARKKEPYNEKKVAKAERQLKNVKERAARLTPHRYIDDIESSLYFSCYAISRMTGLSPHPKRSIEDLCDLNKKRSAWDRDLDEVIELAQGSENIEDLVSTVAAIVRNCQLGLHDAPALVTREEWFCFARAVTEADGWKDLPRNGW